MQKKLEEIVKEACVSNGVSLYDLQWKNTGHGRLLLVKITRIDGVSISLCKAVSRAIENALDHLELIDSRYFLEVSSPGLERELNKKSHFMSAISERVLLTVQGDEVNEKLEGKLLEVRPDSIILEIANKESCEVPFHSIRKARTVFDARGDFRAAKANRKKKEK